MPEAKNGWSPWCCGGSAGRNMWRREHTSKGTLLVTYTASDIQDVIGIKASPQVGDAYLLCPTSARLKSYAIPSTRRFCLARIMHLTT